MAVDTRERILEEASRILRTQGETAATMGAIAEAAAVTRQAVYLHFSNRLELLVEVGNYLDRIYGFRDWHREIEDQPDGVAMLRLFATRVYERGSSMASVLSVVVAARHQSDDAKEAHYRRLQNTVQWLQDVIVSRLVSEGLLHASWNRQEAASLIALLISFRSWDDATTYHSWDREQFENIMVGTVVAALRSPRPDGSVLGGEFVISAGGVDSSR